MIQTILAVAPYPALISFLGRLMINISFRRYFPSVRYLQVLLFFNLYSGIALQVHMILLPVS